jgi:hypothetical protein
MRKAVAAFIDYSKRPNTTFVYTLARRISNDQLELVTISLCKKQGANGKICKGTRTLSLLACILKCHIKMSTRDVSGQKHSAQERHPERHPEVHRNLREELESAKKG